MTSFLDASARIGEILTWPVVILIALLVYRRTLARLVSELGSRITSLSVFQLKFELATVEGAGPGIVLNQLRDTTQAAVADSSHSLYTQLEDSSPADYALIDVGLGNEWITSRLFIAATLLERMRGLRAMVFVERREWSSGRYLLAVASPAVVRWSLARRYPWLELAYARATAAALEPNLPCPDPKTFIARQPIITTDGGALAGGLAGTLAFQFVSSLQDTSASALPSTEWVSLTGYRERAAYVTPELLRELLPAGAFDQHMPEMRDDARSKRVRALLRRRGQVVALVDSNGQFTQLADRGALLEEAAAQLSVERDT